jgi:hypothetical protein
MADTTWKNSRTYRWNLTYEEQSIIRIQKLYTINYNIIMNDLYLSF